MANSRWIMTINVLYIPTPCLVLHGYVLRAYLVAVGRELHFVGVVVHDEVIELEVTCHTTCALANFLLNASVRDECVDSRIVNLAVTRIEPLRCDSRTYCEGVTLTKRTRSILYTASYVALWVTWSNAAPLAKLLEFVHSEVTCHAELCIEHW